VSSEPGTRRPAHPAGERGFTLVELLVVVVVLGILSGIVLFGVARFRGDATLAACKADLATVAIAADTYDARNGSYPTDVATLVSGQYLKSTPSGSYSFDGTTKAATRTPACSDGTATSGSLSAGTATAGPSAAPHQGTSGTMVGVGSSKCVAVANNSSADGAGIQLATCGTVTGQQWTMPSSYPGPIKTLGKCLDVTGGSTANRAYIQLLACDGTGDQLWNLGSAGDMLINPQSGRCLDAENATTTDGTRLIIWDCHGNSNQRWTLP
jgi:prepilin-type N-terminal cleavage/methylation domain-containing protein